MSRAFRAIMAQAGLTDADLERERLKSQRDAANNAALINAAGSVGNGLLGGAFKALDVYRGDVASGADSRAEQAIANHVADVGDDVDTPEKIAAKEADAIEQPSDGPFGGVLDALGGRAAAETKAKAKTTQGVASEMKANKEKAAALEKAKDDEAAKVARDEQARMDATQERSDARAEKQNEAEAARAQALNLERMKEEARLKEIEAKAKAKKGSGDSAGKPLKPPALDMQITHPRSVIDQLDELRAASATAPSGARAGAGDFASKIPIVGPSLQEAIAPGQQDYEGNVAIALANVNNAMDRRVSEATIKLWSHQLANPSLTPEQRATKINEIQSYLRNLQAGRESDLKASGYLVPPAVAHAKPPGIDTATSSDRVVVTNGSETLSIPRSRLQEAQADGFTAVAQ
jgi:hypothetical protein